MTAATILAAEPEAERETVAPRRAEAEDWLRAALGDGLQAARTLIAQARRDGITERTLARARAALGVRAMRIRADRREWLVVMPLAAYLGLQQAAQGRPRELPA